jgi:hypothetical protein
MVRLGLTLCLLAGSSGHPNAAITWPQATRGEEDSLAAAAQVSALLAESSPASQVAWFKTSFFAIRASILGPISSPSWNAKTSSG